MFCSNCGKSIPGNLNYCSGCGIPTDKAPSDVGTPRLFVRSGTIIVIVGLVAFFALLRTLLRSQLETGAIVVITLAYLATIVLMFSVTMGMAWKQISVPGRRKKKKDDLAEEYRAPTSFRDVNTSQLQAGDPGFGSVTDSTTRTLDELTIERRR